MQTMFWPATIAILGGAFFLASAGIFLLAVQYRRHGRLSWRRTVTTATAAIYGFGLFSYTMLPLPSSRDEYCRPGVAIPQLVPGRFLDDFKLVIVERGLSGFATSFTLWQVLFNIILFMPLGILAVRWLRGNIITGVLLGFAASLAIELTQYTGIWGLYTCAYRVADVDDLITNTAGALLGAIIAYLPIFRFLSGPVEADAAQAPARPVTRARRALANVFDAGFTSGALFVIGAALELLQRLGGVDFGEKWMNFWLPLIVCFFVFWLPSLAPGRATLGQRCAWLMVASTQGGPAPAGRALLRSLLGFGGINFLFQISTSMDEISVYPLLNMLAVIYIAISAFYFIFDADHRGLAGRISGTGFIDRRAL
ncbi:VanZ family protein [Glutamicibacter nicotianae]|uniref:VanZ family protein n=1 Tax=Glutamicibacter nicotianae TaxID=37929 RepID=UPI0019575BE3|nr:VanZ family protein [Glutamicibacter nicotianae]MBM7768404.1 glycopeptide antibiotics resistance protein [Glutamicibacter nicotianae]